MAETQRFKRGDRVRDVKFGRTYTVLSQKGSLQVFVEELSNSWIHPGNLRLLADAGREPIGCGERRPKTEVVVQLTGTDGNVFALASAVASALRRAGYQAEAKAMFRELRECRSYDEALQLFMRYVEVE